MTEDLSKARNLSPDEIEKLKEEAKQASQAMDEIIEEREKMGADKAQKNLPSKNHTK